MPTVAAAVADGVQPKHAPKLVAATDGAKAPIKSTTTLLAVQLPSGPLQPKFGTEGGQPQVAQQSRGGELVGADDGNNSGGTTPPRRGPLLIPGVLYYNTLPLCKNCAALACDSHLAP